MDVEDYDYSVLRRYANLFPSSPMTTLIKGYFGYNGIPFVEKDEEEADDEPPADDDEDYAGTIIVGTCVLRCRSPADSILEQDAFGHLPGSILAHRIAAEVYEQEYDLLNVITVAENGLALLRTTEQNIGRVMSR